VTRRKTNTAQEETCEQYATNITFMFVNIFIVVLKTQYSYDLKSVGVQIKKSRNGNIHVMGSYICSSKMLNPNMKISA